jgi:PKD repeat protein
MKTENPLETSKGFFCKWMFLIFVLTLWYIHMKQRSILLSCLLILATFSFAQQRKALFVGNSYTAGMPNVVMAIAQAAGDTLEAMESSMGGQRLSGHAANFQLYDMIRVEQYDYVVLQCQSQECSWPDGQVASEVFPYAQQLCDSIKNQGCTVPMFYMTWGRENGDAQNCASWPPVCTYEGMDSIIYSNYQKMGVANDAEVSPVGAVWRWIRENAPSIQLYSGDGSHPSTVGTVATAFTFYSSIYRKSPDSSSYTGGLPQTTIDTIKMAVKEVLLTDMSVFNIGVNNPLSSFSVSQDGCTFTFDAPSGLEGYTWDFGDGNTSSFEDPTHEYADDKNYIVKLGVIDDCGMKDSTTMSVTCRVNSVDSRYEELLLIYPNPSSGIVNIPFSFSVESVTNLLGESIQFGKLSGNQAKLEATITGLVVLKLKGSNGKFVNRVVLIKP